jgi:hypothetical protein
VPWASGVCSTCLVFGRGFTHNIMTPVRLLGSVRKIQKIGTPAQPLAFSLSIPSFSEFQNTSIPSSGIFLLAA